MNDLSDNKFITELCGGDDLTLNSFMFGGHKVEKWVACRHFYNSVYDMLALMSFNIHLFGYRYLTRLTAMYLACGDYDENSALADIAQHYGTDVRYVVAGITEIIDRNTDFISAASKLLHARLHTSDCRCIRDAVEILGAVYKLHYNFTVDEDELKNLDISVFPIIG